MTTVAGNGGYPYDPFRVYGSKATAVEISADALAMDGSGNLYITDNINRMIWRVTPDGIVHAAVNSFRGYPEHPMATDPGGAVYYLDFVDRYVVNLMRIVNGSTAQLVRNIGDYFYNPLSFAIDGEGNLYLTTYYGARFFKAASDGTVSLLTNTTAPPPGLYFSSMVLDGREFVRGGYRTRACDRAACCDNLHPIPISDNCSSGSFQCGGVQP